MRDNDTKTIKVCADRNKLCPRTYMPISLGSRSVSVNRQAVRQILLQFDNFNLVTSKAWLSYLNRFMVLLASSVEKDLWFVFGGNIIVMLFSDLFSVFSEAIVFPTIRY